MLPIDFAEDFEVSLKTFVYVEDTRDVAASVAVVGSRPYSYQVRVFEPVLESVHDKLMSPGDEVEAVQMVEFARYLRPEEPACAALIEGPGLHVCGVGPHEVCESAFMGHFLSAVN